MIDRSIGKELKISYAEWGSALSSYISEHPLDCGKESVYQLQQEELRNFLVEFKKSYGICLLKFPSGVYDNCVVLYFDTEAQMSMFCLKFL